MALKIISKPTFKTLVTAKCPVDGELVDQSFHVTFRAFTQSEAKEYDTATDEGQKAFLTAAIVTVDDLIDDNDQPIPFSPNVLEQLLDMSWIKTALIMGYASALIEAQRGN